MMRKMSLTDQDRRRLTGLIASPVGRRLPEASRALDAELARAEVVSPRDLGPGVVTMNSCVYYEVADSGARFGTLVYPWDADPIEGRISVLSPLGSALLGLSVGDVVDWPLATGATLRVRVLGVLYQPEAAGDALL